MDNYTFMCSKLPELQEGWEPKVGTYYKWLYTDNNTLGKGLVTQIGTKFKENIAWLPSLEDLIGMLEGIGTWELRKENYDIEYWAESENYNKVHDGDTPQEAMLKLVAYELWHKVWNEDKEVWEEGC